MKGETLLDDDRIIDSIWLNDGGEYSANKDAHPRSGIDKIIAYREIGEMGYIPWFELWCGDQLKYRVNGRFVQGIKYFPSQDRK